MDLQTIFNAGFLGVLAQGGPSRGDSLGRDYCQYRGLGGRKCALGHSIPDGKYNPTFEGVAPGTCSSDHPTVRLANIFGAVSYDDIRALRFFQECHDFATSREYFIENCKRFAREHGLTVPKHDATGPWAGPTKAPKG